MLGVDPPDWYRTSATELNLVADGHRHREVLLAVNYNRRNKSTLGKTLLDFDRHHLLLFRHAHVEQDECLSRSSLEPAVSSPNDEVSEGKKTENLPSRFPKGAKMKSAKE